MFFFAPLRRGGWAIALIACSTGEGQRSEVRLDPVQRITERMDAQQHAWNNGDLEGFMNAYWISDSLVFIGKRGVTYGYAQTLENYRGGYPTRDAMGTLHFENKQFQEVTDGACYVIGKWHLYRNADTLSGHYSLLWRFINADWVITADHSS